MSQSNDSRLNLDHLEALTDDDIEELAVDYYRAMTDSIDDVIGFGRAVERAVLAGRAALANQPAPTVPEPLSREYVQEVWRKCNAHLYAFAEAIRAHQPAQEQAEPTWGAVETVGDMVRNLLTLDQAAPVFTAFHVTIDGQRRCRVTQGITISRERVVDGKWIDSASKDVPYTNIVWAKTDERAQQEPVAAPQQVPQTELIELLQAIRPSYGDVGSRDVDVTAQRKRIDRAIELLSAPKDCSGTPSSCPDNEGYGCHCSAAQLDGGQEGSAS